MNQAQDTTPHALQDSIHQALQLDLQASEDLLQLLQAEQTAMEERDRQALADIVNAKTDCLNRIEQQAGRRYQILESLQRPIDEKEWKVLIEAQDNDEIQSTWQALIETLEQCRHCNEVNGRLVSRGQQTLNHLLSVIRGQFNPPSLYNQRGNKEGQHGGHTVTRA